MVKRLQNRFDLIVCCAVIQKSPFCYTIPPTYNDIIVPPIFIDQQT